MKAAKACVVSATNVAVDATRRFTGSPRGWRPGGTGQPLVAPAVSPPIRSLVGVGTDYQQVIKGLVLLAAVGFDVYNKRKAGS